MVYGYIAILLYCTIALTEMDKRQQLLSECHEAFSVTESARILALYRSRDNRLSFDERLSITKEIEKVFYPVYLELRNTNPSLTDWDLMLCVLSFEGFSVSVIAECFSVSNDAVRMRKSRLREKLPQEWFSLIFHIVTKMYQDNCHDCVTDNVLDADDASIPLAPENQNKNVMKQPIKMTFGQSIINGLTGTFKFKGRVSRTEFWYYTLFCFLAQIALLVLYVATRIVLDAKSVIYPDNYITMGWIVMTALIAISHSAAAVKRIHDTERGGWLWCVAYLIPWLTLITMIVWHIEYDVYLRNLDGPYSTDHFIMNWFHGLLTFNVLVIIATNILVTFWYCGKGTAGPNYYGPDPLYRDV